MNTLPTDFQRLQAQQNYTDLNQLNTIRQLGNKDQSAALRKVAEQFESMFLHMMLKSMRSAGDVIAKDNPLNSYEVNFHKDMLDHQMSLSLADQGGIGLADALYRQLSGQFISPNAKSGQVSSQEFDPFSKATINQNPYTTEAGFYQQREDDKQLLEGINSPEEFIEAITPYAKSVAKELNTDYRFIIAQAALETGWGKHVIRDRYGNHSFNLFNIKADSRWSGHHVNVSTIEYEKGVAVKESANFRRYDSIAESFNDYQQFLQQPRYQQALADSDDGQDFIQHLHQAGYATDPHYADKISRIVNQYF